MSRCTSLVLSLAMLAASMPAVASDPMDALLGRIQRAQDRRQYAAAAELAAPASRRTDLSAVDRYLLAGLASQSYGDAFTYGAAPRQARGEAGYLCAQRTVLQEAAILAGDAERTAIVRDALQVVAEQLAAVAASGDAVPCVVNAEPVLEEATPVISASSSGEPSRMDSPSSSVAAPAVAVEGPAPLPSTVLPRPRSPARMGMGVGLLVAGAGLVGGLAASMVARGRLNDTIAGLDAAATAQGRELSPQEAAAVHVADAGFVRLSHAGAALGTLAGLSLITGVLLLAVPARPRPTSRARLRPTGAGVHLTF